MSILLAHTATHRGAPFVGRRREVGILTHLVEEGLWGALRLVRVAGPAGMGRRRLIEEAFHRGPDAEWVRLAPGGVEADPAHWIRTELMDLLDTYPGAPYPSWALHTLARWAPALRLRAPVPALSRERLPADREPEVVGAAIGALLRAVTGHTLVVVDAGLWPRAHARRRRLLESLSRSLAGPGTVMLAAADPAPAGEVDPTGVRTLGLAPLAEPELRDLVARWNPESDGAEFSGWLHRITGGVPLFVHETVRWLEELGHARVDDERGAVALLDPGARLPLPLGLAAVMTSRYRRIPAGAARLLHLLTGRDGELEVEALREIAGGERDTFEEALAVLRRREFLLRRSFRRPTACATPLWREVVTAEANRRPRLRHRFHVRSPEPPAPPAPPRSALAMALGRLNLIRRELARTADGSGSGDPAGHGDSIDRGRGDPAGHGEAGAPVPRADGDVAAELTFVARLARGRPGLAWDGVRGRLARSAAQWRLRGDRPGAAELWTRWGLARLRPDVHPGLRRSVAAVRATLLAQRGDDDAAAKLRETMRVEALEAGHLVAAALLAAEVAERQRRRGRGDTALALARGALTGLEVMGLEAEAALAARTAATACLDAGKLDEAERELAWLRARRPEVAAELQSRFDARRAEPPEPVPWTVVERAPATPSLRLRLFGRPAVERSESAWPLALWPEWWKRLWMETVTRELLGERLPRDHAEIVLGEAGDAPDAALETLLAIANRLLREHQPMAGGLWLEPDHVRMNAAGIACDATVFFALARRGLGTADTGAAAKAETPGPAAATAETPGPVAAAASPIEVPPPAVELLLAGDGIYLPPLGGASEERVRDAQRAALARALDTVRHDERATSAFLDPDRRSALLEGPGRVADVAGLLAQLMENRGRNREAFALRRASP